MMSQAKYHEENCEAKILKSRLDNFKIALEICSAFWHHKRRTNHEETINSSEENKHKRDRLES